MLGNPGLASSGGVLRDSNENWLRGLSHKLGITNSLATELWGVRDGLLLACDLNIRKLIIESDAKSIVDLLKTENLGNNAFHSYSALINDCRYLILSCRLRRPLFNMLIVRATFVRISWLRRGTTF